jgi:hypothetical protein
MARRHTRLTSPALVPDRYQKGNLLQREGLSAFCASIPSIRLLTPPMGAFLVLACAPRPFPFKAPFVAAFATYSIPPHNSPTSYRRIRVLLVAQLLPSRPKKGDCGMWMSEANTPTCLTPSAEQRRQCGYGGGISPGATRPDWQVLPGRRKSGRIASSRTETASRSTT